MPHPLGATDLLTNMGVMENNLLTNNNNTNGATSTPSSLSPDLPASESSESCVSPMSHSPTDSSLNNLINSNHNNLIQSPQITDKHSTRSHSPSNSTSSSISTKSSALNSTPTRSHFQAHTADTTLTNELVNGTGGGGGAAACSSPKSKSHNNNDDDNYNNDAGNTSSDDYSDEIKVYNEEGAAEEEQRNEDYLKEEKTEIIKQTIEEKASPSNPFSINNLMNYNGLAAAAGGKNNASVNPFGANPFAAAAAFGALNQQRASLFNPAALYSQELANHFASWWPAAAAGATSFNPYSSPAFNPFNAFNAAAANYQQQAAAAAVFQAAAASRFSPSLFLPPPAGTNGLASPKVESSSHSASSSASSTSSTASSSSSSAFSSNSNPNIHSPFSGSSSSSSSRFNGNNQQNAASPHRNNNNIDREQNYKHSTKKSKNYENSYQSMQPNQMNNNMGHHGNGNHKMHQMNNPLHQSQQNHNFKQEHLTAPVPHVMVKEKAKKPHVKKPLNAFMLFMKEQRAAVVADCTLRESAAINQILGRKWHELERTEQAKYYEKARLARLEHMQNNPGWSARDNYGLKKKRRRKREKVIGENGELPRKCRARYGLHQLNLWCKPCRRKKKCIRFANEEGQNGNQMMQGPNGQMYNGMSNMEPGSGGSMNGGNSEDDYENYEEDSDESEEETDDENDDGQYQQSPKPNKLPHLMNPHSGAGSLSAPAFNLPTNHPGNLMQNHYQQQMQQHQQHQQGQHHQQFQQMQNSHLLNNHLLKQMGAGGMPGGGPLDNKAMLHQQLRLNQESI